MTWLRYTGDYQPDINIRLEDVVGVTVGRIPGSSIYEVVVYYSDGQDMGVGTFSPAPGTKGNPAHDSTEAYEMAKERAEEIKAAVDKAKG